MDKTIVTIKQKGTTLLEALVATAIIGIGFIAIFQMVTYSVRSIDVSGERTKINYLTDTILEDLLAYKSSERDNTKLYDAIIDDRNASGVYWEMAGCNDGIGIVAAASAEENVVNKWDNRFSQRRIKCNNPADTKTLRTYTICRDAAECTNINNDIYDKLYFGKLEILVGNKRKNLYFRVH